MPRRILDLAKSDGDNERDSVLVRPWHDTRPDIRHPVPRRLDRVGDDNYIQRKVDHHVKMIATSGEIVWEENKTQ